jgi:hypothetical protein
MRRWCEDVNGRPVDDQKTRKGKTSKLLSADAPLTNVLDTRPDEGLIKAPPVHGGGTSERGPAAPCPWLMSAERAATFNNGVNGIPDGSARTVGGRVTAFFTACKLAMLAKELCPIVVGREFGSANY